MLSVVIPAHDEEGSIVRTVTAVHHVLKEAGIEHELLVVDDHSRDATWEALQRTRARIGALRPLRNDGPGGFGHAIRFGLERYAGDRVAIMMADLSDPPEDLVRFVQAMDRHRVDCVFGSRAMKGAVVRGYPRAKWVVNRLANWFLCAVFQYRYNDTTNPFKLYTRQAMDRARPLSAAGFELEIELPLKAIIRGCSYVVVPNGWNGREEGESKMGLAKLFGPYLRVVLSCLAERLTGSRNR